MTLYFLHLRDGDLTYTDIEGKDYAGLAEAQAEAKQAAREMTAEMIRTGGSVNGTLIEICDADGALLDQITLKSTIRLV
jgi:hypothetical protein